MINKKNYGSNINKKSQKVKNIKRNKNNNRNKNTNKNKNILIIIIIFIILIIAIGITYAYFTTNKTTEFGRIVSGNIDMQYASGDELLLTSATPIYEKDVDNKASFIVFSIKNTGTVNMYTDIYLEGISMSDKLSTSDFKWRIEQGESLTNEGFKNSFEIDTGTFENLNGANSKLLITNRSIEPNTTKYYKIKIWVEETGKIQNDIMGANFKAKVKAVGYAKTKSKSFANNYPVINNTVSNRMISNLKVYGNSVQDGTPSPTNPVEIQNVGDLVTDETDENYGKYKIPITVSGKNLMTTFATQTFTNRNFNGNFYVFSVNIPEGQTITASADVDATLAGTDSNGVTLILTYDDDTTYTYNYWDSGCIKIPKGKKGRSYTTVTAKKKVKKISYRIHTFNGSTPGTTVFSNFQLEVGNSISYEPYQEPTTYNIYLDEPLRGIGKHQDYIDFENKQVVRKIKERILNSDISTTYLKYNTNYNLIVYIADDDGISFKNNNREYSGFNTHFPMEEVTWSQLQNGYFQYPSTFYSDKSYMLIKYNEITSTESLINWLDNEEDNGTPIKFYYPLATPDNKEIDLPNIKTKNKTTVLSVDTSIQSSVSGTY